MTRPDPSSLGRCGEVVGPPGAGKSSILSALEACSDVVRPASAYRSLARMPLFVRGRLSTASIFRESEARLLSPKERKLITRLEATRGILRRESAKGVPAVIFDQGPIYALAMLGQSRRRHAAGVAFDGWFDDQVRVWGRALDVVIALDAPDDVLVSRVRTRTKHHAIKELSSLEAHAAVADDRDLYDSVLDAMALVGQGPRMLRFDTSRSSIDEIVQQTMTALGHGGASCSL